MNDFLLLKTLSICSPFHTEHYWAPEFSRNPPTYATMWLLLRSLLSLPLSLSLSLSLSLCVFFCWEWWWWCWGYKKQMVYKIKHTHVLMLYRLYISNLFYPVPTHNVSMVDSQRTHFFVRKTHVKINSCRSVNFHHTKVSTNFGFIYM